jgi:hypothetical protein
MLAFHLPAGSNVQNKTGACSVLSTTQYLLDVPQASHPRQYFEKFHTGR